MSGGDGEKGGVASDKVRGEIGKDFHAKLVNCTLLLGTGC
jgi:hypothetical protein